MTVPDERQEIDDRPEQGDPSAPLEEDSDELTGKPKPQYFSIWQVIRRFFYKNKSERDAEQRTRLYMLNQAIETYPEAAVNYLLRGELYIEMKIHEAAQKDLQTAIDLAETQYKNDRWGLGSQAIQDRATRALKRIT